MPFIGDVENLMRRRLETDNPTAMSEAGKVWKKLPMNHYYGREDTADIVGAEVAVQAAALDKMQLSDQVLRLLQRDIGLSTIVDDVITRIFVATMAPEPL
jgi:hypothetical protein